MAVLKRNKALTNGVELEWATVSYSPITEYRVRYRKQSVSHSIIKLQVVPYVTILVPMQAHQWEELILKAKEQEKPVDNLVHNHVHQLHGLEAGTEYELAIESMNKFGWSRPLMEKFSTLGHLDSKFLSLFNDY